MKHTGFFLLQKQQIIVKARISLFELCCPNKGSSSFNEPKQPKMKIWFSFLVFKVTPGLSLQQTACTFKHKLTWRQTRCEQHFSADHLDRFLFANVFMQNEFQLGNRLRVFLDYKATVASLSH